MTGGASGPYSRWRQFSALQPTDAERLASNVVRVGPDDVVLVCSHDCDVLHHDLELEPTVELIVARGIHNDEEEGIYFQGRNPRLLQFRFPEGGGQLFEIRPFERWSVRREELKEIAPRTDWSLSDDLRRTIASWLARRFLRTALPDSFNDRLRGAKSQIREALKKGSEIISGIYVAIDPEVELGAEVDYEMTLTAVMKVEDYEVPALRAKAYGILNKISGAVRGCSGVKLIDPQLLSEAAFSLDDLRNSDRLDTDEDLSQRSPGHPLPPDR